MTLFLVHSELGPTQEMFKSFNRNPKTRVPNGARSYLKTERLKKKDEIYTLCSLELTPSSKDRSLCLILPIICLVIVEIVTLPIPLVPKTHGLLLSLLSLLLILVGYITLRLTIARLASRYAIYDSSFRMFIKSCGTEVYTLFRTNNFVLFPSDAVIIPTGIFVLCILQLVAYLNLWNILSQIFPLILFLIIFLIPYCASFYVSWKMRDATTFLPQIFWKLEITRLILRVNTIFIAIISLYITLNLIGNITLYIASIPLTQFSITRLFADQMPYLVRLVSGGFHYENFIDLLIYNYNDVYHNLLYHVLIFGQLTILIIWFVWYFLGLRYFAVFKSSHWESLELKPAEVPKNIASQGRLLKINAVILVQWIALSLINIVGASLAILWLLTVLHIPLDWVPIRFIFPFIWYEASFQFIFGTVVGEIIAAIVLLLIIGPSLIWLSFWICSLFHTFWLFLVYLFSRPAKNQQAQVIIEEMCKERGFRSPKVWIEADSVQLPTTIPLLPIPGFCIICLSSVLEKMLNEEELRVMLAHELAHVRHHASKLWWTQLISRIGIIGPGYLTLLLNYWDMEMSADLTAVYWTGDREGLLSLLGQLDALGEMAKIVLLELVALQGNAKQEEKKNLHWGIVSSIVEQFTRVYKIYFGDALWGTLHPSPEVRVMYLSLKENFHESNQASVQGSSTFQRTN